MVYSADGIPGAEALSAHKRLYALLGLNLKWKYSELCGFVRASMSQVIVRSSSLILCGPQEKEVHNRQQPDVLNGAVMELIVTCRS